MDNVGLKSEFFRISIQFIRAQKWPTSCVSCYLLMQCQRKCMAHLIAVSNSFAMPCKRDAFGIWLHSESLFFACWTKNQSNDSLYVYRSLIVGKWRNNCADLLDKLSATVRFDHRCQWMKEKKRTGSHVCFIFHSRRFLINLYNFSLRIA